MLAPRKLGPYLEQAPPWRRTVPFERPFLMQQPRGRLFDDMAQIMTDAASLAHGVRREAETILRTQAERLLATMDVVTREEFEAVREMSILARDENEVLRRRIEALEAQVAGAAMPKA